MAKLNGKSSLKHLQSLLGALKIEPRGETVTGEIAFMPNISSALVKTTEGIYMIGVSKRPQADPGLFEEPYLHYFVDALVALNELTLDEAAAALPTLARQRAARVSAEDLDDLKAHARTRGYSLVKKTES
jgi:hypothetical protein